MTKIDRLLKKRPKILITNDDGIHAPGLKHLWSVIKEIADVTVVAPSKEQSAVSLSITIRNPLNIEPIEWHHEKAHVWSVNGTPCDCVKLALNVILEEKPDLILSGINRGSNAGRNVLYSGTVAAVIEGVLHDIPGIAFSSVDFQEPCYKSTDEAIILLTEYLLQHPLRKGSFLNVNFPQKSFGVNKGIRITKQGQEFLAENPEKRIRHHPGGEADYYWLGSRIAQFEEQPDCDISWLNKGYISVVPIHVSELTDHQEYLRHLELFDQFILPSFAVTN